MHTPRKRFGQHFLVDQQIIQSILQALAPKRDDNIVEIGPGLGALTRPLVKLLDQLNAVELDRDIVARLSKEFDERSLRIYSADVLDFDFKQLGPQLRVIGNLPYNISTPLLFHLSEFPDIQDIHVMLQKEVVERMVAEPSTAAYGRLSVMLQYRYQMEKLLDVPPEAFQPPPKVESAVVRMIPYHPLPCPAQDEQTLALVVKQAFSQRRKTLRNTLKGYFSVEGFAALDIPSTARAEELDVAAYVKLSNYLRDKKQNN